MSTGVKSEMIRPARARWALSFADLSLLLLGFFVLLQANLATRKQALAGLNSYFGALKTPHQIDLKADALFQPGEALLSEQGRVELGKAAKLFGDETSEIRVQSLGLAKGEQRFDSWDLSAARLGAVARALVAAGVKPERIQIAGLAETDDSDPQPSGQTIRLAEGAASAQ